MNGRGACHQTRVVPFSGFGVLRTKRNACIRFLGEDTNGTVTLRKLLCDTTLCRVDLRLSATQHEQEKDTEDANCLFRRLVGAYSCKEKRRGCASIGQPARSNCFHPTVRANICVRLDSHVITQNLPNQSACRAHAAACELKFSELREVKLRTAP